MDKIQEQNMINKLTHEALEKQDKNKVNKTLISLRFNKYQTCSDLVKQGCGYRFGEYIRQLRRDNGISITCQKYRDKQGNIFGVYWLPAFFKEPILGKQFTKIGVIFT